MNERYHNTKDLKKKNIKIILYKFNFYQWGQFTEALDTESNIRYAKLNSAVA